MLDPVEEPFDPVAGTIEIGAETNRVLAIIFGWDVGPRAFLHGKWVKQIPMAAFVAVMIMVSISTFNWASIKNLRSHPLSSSIVMLATGDLSMGVLASVVLSGVM